jgi:hypothetical protein
MKFVQTLYFNKSVDPFKSGFGWVAAEYHLCSWALSCLQLCRIYKKVDLYSSQQRCMNLLIESAWAALCQLHYITHDNLDMADENLWALPKIRTYSLQTRTVRSF